MYDIIKEFIQNFRRSDVPHELKKRAFFRSPAELRKFKNKIALRRKLQHEKKAEKRAEKMRDHFSSFKNLTIYV